MPNQEHLKILQQGAKAWNEWMEIYDDIPDLCKADLQNHKKEKAPVG